MDIKNNNNISIQIEKYSENKSEKNNNYCKIIDTTNKSITKSPKSYNGKNVGNNQNKTFFEKNQDLIKNKYFIEFLEEMRYPIKGFINILQYISNLINNSKEIITYSENNKNNNNNQTNFNPQEDITHQKSSSPYNINFKTQKNLEIHQIELNNFKEIKTKLNLLNSMHINFAIQINQLIGFSYNLTNKNIPSSSDRKNLPDITNSNKINNIEINNTLYFKKIKEDLNFYKFYSLEDNFLRKLFVFENLSIAVSDIDLYTILINFQEIIKSTNNYNFNKCDKTNGDSLDSNFCPKLFFNENIKKFNIKSNEFFFQILLFNIINHCMKTIKSGIIILGVEILKNKKKISLFITINNDNLQNNLSRGRKISDATNKTLDLNNYSKNDFTKKNYFTENYPNLYISKLIAEKLKHNILYETENGGEIFSIEMDYDENIYILDKSEIDCSNINITENLPAYQGIEKCNDGSKLISNSVYNSFSNIDGSLNNVGKENKKEGQ